MQSLSLTNRTHTHTDAHKHTQNRIYTNTRMYAWCIYQGSSLCTQISEVFFSQKAYRLQVRRNNFHIALLGV